MSIALKKFNAEVKALKKKHPKMTHAEAQQKVSKAHKAGKKISGHKRSASSVKNASAHRTTNSVKVAPKKVKLKIKPGKKGVSSVTISGINHAKVGQELKHRASLENALLKHKTMLKDKGLTPSDKSGIRRDIKTYQDSIRETKRHISALKRGI